MFVAAEARKDVLWNNENEGQIILYIDNSNCVNSVLCHFNIKQHNYSEAEKVVTMIAE